MVFHAGTARDGDGRVVTDGGRVLAVSGARRRRSPTRATARTRPSRAISFDGMQFRTRHRRSGGGRRSDVSDETPLVGVLAASPSELPIMRQAGLILEKFDIPHEVRIMSSSRNPDLVDEYARTAFERGLKVVICSTGMSGHLAAAVAARTVLPVIGVPIATSPQMVGNEALAITAQMPTGVPVATVGRRRRGERGDPRRADPRGGRPGGAGHALEVQGRPGGGPQAVIPVQLPEMAGVWSDEARMRELARDRARSRSRPGRSSAWSRRRTRAAVPRARRVHVEAVLERERVTRHDVAAFVDVVAASIGPEGRWVHFGLTSSDVLDTGLALQLRAARRRAARRAREAARRR